MATPGAEPSQDAIEDVDLYRMVRSQIEFEAGLISQRLNWFVASQSFLFTAYAITLNGLPGPSNPLIVSQLELLHRLVPVVALASAVLIYAAVTAAMIAQQRLRRFLVSRVPAERLSFFPAIQGAQLTRSMGGLVPLGLPVVFMVVWAILFLKGLG